MLDTMKLRNLSWDIRIYPLIMKLKLHREIWASGKGTKKIRKMARIRGTIPRRRWGLKKEWAEIVGVGRGLRLLVRWTVLFKFHQTTIFLLLLFCRLRLQWWLDSVLKRRAVCPSTIAMSFYFDEANGTCKYVVLVNGTIKQF